jgi:GDP-4-dehydro-6-deoxy-D-mannose reductase
MRAFVTGGHGFVGTWLRRYLEAEGDEVVAPGPEVDVTDAEALRRALQAARPDALYHLAAASHVGQSWEDPREKEKEE